jgi:hypothetical protein
MINRESIQKGSKENQPGGLDIKRNLSMHCQQDTKIEKFLSKLKISSGFTQENSNSGTRVKLLTSRKFTGACGGQSWMIMMGKSVEASFRPHLRAS